MSRRGINIKRHRLLIVLKIVGWTVMAVALFGVGIVVATVQILSPDKLTPMVNEAANKMLNAEVSVDKVELSVRHSFPFLNLDVDNLSILSKDILSLPKAARDTIPAWGDTLACVSHIHGGINIISLLRGVIDIHDVEIREPQVNVLIVNEKINNFSIAKSSPPAPADTTPAHIPDIRINRFALVDTRPVRFADMTQQLHATLGIASMRMTGDSPSHGYLPAYAIDFQGNFASPLLEIIGQQQFKFGLDGTVEWHYKTPYQLHLKDFDYMLFMLSGHANSLIDFSDQMTVESLDVSLNPMAVNDVLAIMPESLAADYGLPPQFDTNASLAARVKLLRPYVVGSIFLPYATLTLEVPDCYLRYELLDIRRFAATVDVELHGSTPNQIEIDIPHFVLAGPATQLSLTGHITDPITDPMFRGEINGDIEIARLPNVLSDRLRATLSGKATFDSRIELRPSMFCRERFHNIKIDGKIDVDKFYYLAYDTLTMVSVGRAQGRFGTNEKVTTRQGAVVDSLLQGVVEVDTADILVSGLDIRGGGVRLSAGALNTAANTDTTLVIPMGGILTARSFSLVSIADTARLKVKDLAGSVSMRRYKGDAHLPLFGFSVSVGRMGIGNAHTMMMMSGASLQGSIGKLPVTELSKSRRELRAISDSISRVHPEIPIDSVYILAKEIRARHRGHSHRRLHAVHEADSTELIDWGTSHSLTTFLLDWRTQGTLKAKRAGLFTRSFPLRNRMRNLELNFCNDSISLTNVEYKVGHSDFLISGNITNMKRGLTSTRRPSPLKVNFKVLSDTIEVNELANAFFTGAAAKSETLDMRADSDAALEHQISADSAEVKGPFIIPTNIDAELSLTAKNVIYSDITLHNLSGTALLYDGALNLNELKAASDVGKVDLTALYSAPSPQNMHFGFGLQLSDFNISNFLKLVPAVDSIMPLMRDLSGIIDANIAATSRITRNMDLDLPTLKAAMRIEGDSIVFLDPATFRKVAKWLLFKDKNRNVIDKVTAEMVVDDGEMRLYPFIFDFDRYKLGIQGYNDFDMNFHYHVAVLKSPIPFKFGINLSGNYDKLKIRLGRARFNEKTTATQVPIVNDTRVNLINQIQNVFRRGVRNSDFATVNISDKPLAEKIDLAADTLTAADSLYFRQEGLIP